MSIGIIAEYNPFHNGHLYQINEVKKRLNPDLMVAVVSGDFVQRGELSFLDKWEKALLALENGIDLVAELPVYYSIQNAETFCRAAVRILQNLRVKVQVFGSEAGEMTDLKQVIQIQNTDSYVNILRKNLKAGNNYSVSHFNTLREFGLENKFLSNNILAMEYIKAMEKDKTDIEPYLLKRINTGYNDEKISGNISSASNIRKMFYENKLEENKNVLPGNVYNLVTAAKTSYIKEGMGGTDQKLYELFRYKILNRSFVGELSEIYDVGSDLASRLLKYSYKHMKYSDFILEIQARNISPQKIKRSILNTLFDIRQEDTSFSHHGPEYVRILGFNHKGQKYLHRLKKEYKVENIYTDWKNIEKKESVEKNWEAKIKIEKTAFLLKELLLQKKENLNSIIQS